MTKGKEKQKLQKEKDRELAKAWIEKNGTVEERSYFSSESGAWTGKTGLSVNFHRGPEDPPFFSHGVYYPYFVISKNYEHRFLRRSTAEKFAIKNSLIINFDGKKEQA